MNNLSVLSIVVAFVAFLIAIGIIFYLLVSEYGKIVASPTSFYMITDDMRKAVVTLNNNVIIYSKNSYEGELSIQKGRAGEGTLIYIRNSTENPLYWTSGINFFIPETYTSPENPLYFVPAFSTMLLALQSREIGYFLGLIK